MSSPGARVRAALGPAKLASPGAVEDFWAKELASPGRTHRAYVSYSSRVPLNKHVIFYETMTGDRMNDNPYAIFEYLRSHPEYGSFLHVWSLGKHGDIPEQYAELDDVVFARRNTLSYAYFLASAGHIVANATLPGFLTRREGQRYLNTWHGIPYKAVGRGGAVAKFGLPSGPATFLKATHVVTPCEFMTDALLYSYSMTGTSTAVVAETGYPRVDLTVNADAEQVSHLRRALGIEDARGASPKRPVVLYAPTWRSDGGEDTVDVDKLMEDLARLAALDIDLMYRGHHRVGRLLHDTTVGDQVGRIIVPPQHISSNELLAAVDILITDYSSIFFDFLPTGRPIVHYLYDLDEYTRTRGLNLGVDELPGAVAQSADALVEAVQHAAAALRDQPAGADVARSPIQGEQYRAAQLRFAPHEDGSSSQRAVDFFFKDQTVGVPTRTARDGRQTVVFWAGCLRDDAESKTFLEDVLRIGAAPECQVTLVVDREAYIARDTLRGIKALGDQLSCIPYYARTPVLLQSEAPAYEDFVGRAPGTFDEVRDVIRGTPVLCRVFSREYRRRLDDAHFDTVLLAPGLSQHELAVAAFASTKKLSPKAAGGRLERLPAPVRSAVRVLLPKGSARRRRAEQAYRSLRRR